MLRHPHGDVFHRVEAAPGAVGDMVVAANRVGLPSGRLYDKFARVPFEEHEGAIFSVRLIDKHLDNAFEHPAHVRAMFERI